MYLSIFTWLILFVADFVIVIFLNKRGHRQFFFFTLPGNQTKQSTHTTQAGCSGGSADVPVRIHLLAGPSLGRLPSAINHGVIHPPLLHLW